MWGSLTLWGWHSTPMVALMSLVPCLMLMMTHQNRFHQPWRLDEYKSLTLNRRTFVAPLPQWLLDITEGYRQFRHYFAQPMCASFPKHMHANLIPWESQQLPNPRDALSVPQWPAHIRLQQLHHFLVHQKGDCALGHDAQDIGQQPFVQAAHAFSPQRHLQCAPAPNLLLIKICQSVCPCTVTMSSPRKAPDIYIHAVMQSCKKCTVQSCKFQRCKWSCNA